MKKIILLFIPLSLYAFSFSQDPQDLPTDYLSKEFHVGRREALRELMPPKSVAVIFAYPERIFSQDVNYKYHQNPDLYYFSGYNEPNSVLFIFKDEQTTDNKKYNELFFIQQKDSLKELWTGTRMGVNRVKSDLGFDMVFNGADFKNFPLDFSKFDKILFENLPLTVDDSQDSADLHDLIEEFKQKAAISEPIIDRDQDILNSLVAYANMQNLHYFTEYLQKQVTRGAITAAYSLGKQITVQNILDIKDSAALNAIKEQINSERINTGLYNKCVGELRQIKTPEELALLKKSVAISSIAHAEVMKAIQPGVSEFALEGFFQYIHKRYGAEDEGYPPIVGGGSNGCHLHYQENTKTNIHDEMALMDVASAYHGYSADVTRTVPSTGKFSTEQKAIYDLVYKAQEEVFKLCKEGALFDSTENKATEVLAAGLIQLGIIKTKEEVRTYYPHGCSHFIGLDVHDKGIYDKMFANMAITVEPGIYIPENSACDKKWWSIAVRIEDDILITKNGYELLSKDAPRKSEDVEKMVAQKSVLDDFKLPKLSE